MSEKILEFTTGVLASIIAGIIVTMMVGIIVSRGTVIAMLRRMWHAVMDRIVHRVIVMRHRRAFLKATVVLATSFAVVATLVIDNITVNDTYPAFDTSGDRSTLEMRISPASAMPTPAQDLDGDGKAEDINGNGRLDFSDVVILFNNVESPKVLDHVALFDFQTNGQVDHADAVWLADAIIDRLP